MKHLRARFPVSIEKPFNSVLVQEMQRFKPLAMLLRSSALGLVQVIQGQKSASLESEAMHDSVMHGEVPEVWKKRAYPSERGLLSFVRDLIKRLGALKHWIRFG